MIAMSATGQSAQALDSDDDFEYREVELLRFGLCSTLALCSLRGVYSLIPQSHIINVRLNCNDKKFIILNMNINSTYTVAHELDNGTSSVALVAPCT